VKALTDASSSNTANKDAVSSTTVQQQKQNFRQAASQYFSLLSAVDVRLRRQIYALEEAEIIPPDAPPKEQPVSLTVPSAFAAFGNESAALSAKQMALSKTAGGGGGLGSLDVGWLNSRNDDVGKEMEAGLWAEAEEFLEHVEKGDTPKVEDDMLLLE
jgi:hypothetical protein